MNCTLLITSPNKHLYPTLVFTRQANIMCKLNNVMAIDNRFILNGIEAYICTLKGFYVKNRRVIAFDTKMEM